MGKNTVCPFAFRVFHAVVLLIVTSLGATTLRAQQANYLLAPNDLISVTVFQEDDLATKADGKDVHLDAEIPRHGKVAELVKEHDNGNDEKEGRDDQGGRQADTEQRHCVYNRSIHTLHRSSIK